MALGPQLRQKPRPSASVFVYWVPRAMFFTRHGRPWSNPTTKHHNIMRNASLYKFYVAWRLIYISHESDFKLKSSMLFSSDEAEFVSELLIYHQTKCLHTNSLSNPGSSEIVKVDEPPFCQHGATTGIGSLVALAIYIYIVWFRLYTENGLKSDEVCYLPDKFTMPHTHSSNINNVFIQIIIQIWPCLIYQ